MGVDRKKSYEIVKASKRSKDVKGMFVGSTARRMKFDKEGRMIVHDAGLAKEIDQKYGNKPGGSKDVVVIEVDDLRKEHRRSGTGARRVWRIKVPWK